MLAIEDTHRRLDDLAIVPDTQLQQLTGMAAALGVLPSDMMRASMAARSRSAAGGESSAMKS